ISSPVSLRGPGNQSASASSITSPLTGSRTRASVACRGCGTRPINLSSATDAFGPHTLITATALGGRPEESAKMVGRSFCICTLSNECGVRTSPPQPSIRCLHDLASPHLVDPPKPPRTRDESVPPPTPNQSGRLVGVGAGSFGRGKAQQQADPPLGRLCRLPLVPRDGARKL